MEVVGIVGNHDRGEKSKMRKLKQEYLEIVYDALLNGESEFQRGKSPFNDPKILESLRSEINNGDITTLEDLLENFTYIAYNLNHYSKCLKNVIEDENDELYREEIRQKRRSCNILLNKLKETTALPRHIVDEVLSI